MKWVDRVILLLIASSGWICTHFAGTSSREVIATTDLSISQLNIRMLARLGRSRWKIENECFNTLKNHGYEIEHNYGHGNQHLAFNIYLLILIAFLFHQVAELTDRVISFPDCQILSSPRIAG